MVIDLNTEVMPIVDLRSISITTSTDYYYARNVMIFSSYMLIDFISLIDSY